MLVSAAGKNGGSEQHARSEKVRRDEKRKPVKESEPRRALLGSRRRIFTD
jgi:hypothetical protein